MIEIPKKFDIEKARIARANEARREQVEQNELEQLRGIILTIFALERNLHKMRGHECFAKHWALSLLDRVKRMKKGGSMSGIKIVDWPKRPAEQRRDQLERENAELRKRLAEIEEREAACCPEDVGFDEYIEGLKDIIKQMREALRLALLEARSTHCENTIKAALAAERGGE